MGVVPDHDVHLGHGAREVDIVAFRYRAGLGFTDELLWLMQTITSAPSSRKPLHFVSRAVLIQSGKVSAPGLMVNWIQLGPMSSNRPKRMPPRSITMWLRICSSLSQLLKAGKLSIGSIVVGIRRNNCRDVACAAGRRHRPGKSGVGQSASILIRLITCCLHLPERLPVARRCHWPAQESPGLSAVRPENSRRPRSFHFIAQFIFFALLSITVRRRP